jgi:hypothetical protein
MTRRRTRLVAPTDDECRVTYRVLTVSGDEGAALRAEQRAAMREFLLWVARSRAAPDDTLTQDRHTIPPRGA